MIIVNIKGGLGNQMFQYAFSKWLEDNFNEKAKFNILSFEGESIKQNMNNRRSFILEDAFDIKLDLVNKKYLDVIVPKSFVGKFYKKIRTRLLKQKLIYVNDQLFNNPTTDLNFTILYADGYWGSLNYLSKLVLYDIFPFNPIRSEVKDILIKHTKDRLVSVHIRRGDYLNNKNFYVLKDKYYKEAFSLFETENTHFLIFGDDKDFITYWPLLKSLNHTIINGMGFKDYEELFIMTQCESNIIANSTFSWWGAMLNPNLNKKVVCPKNWFSNKKLESTFPNMIPPYWIKI